MNRPYELGFIIPTSVPENSTQEVIDAVKDMITKVDGAVNKMDYWGRRRLAYPISDFREGYYVFFEMDFPPSQVDELERQLRLYDSVIRHLVVRLDE